MIRMVVFDMAGTVIDEGNVVYKTLCRAINHAGYTFTLDEVLAEGAGKEKFQAVKDILSLKNASVDETESKRIYGNFLASLEQAYATLNVRSQPSAEEIFTFLKANGILVVLNTGYNRHTAELLLKKIGWQTGKHFDLLVTATDVAKSRPNPDMIDYAIQKYHLAGGDEVVKVGDSIIDVEEGKRAGCIMTVGVTTGAHTRQQLISAHPDWIIGNLSELIKIINLALVI